MTHEETVEGNVLIAGFMGYETDNDNGVLHFIIPEHPIEVHWMGNADRYERDMLKYHQNWEWLMPVIDKIESLGSKVQTSTSPRCSRHYCEIRVFGFAHEWADTKIEAAYNAIVKFIKWYNQREQQ
jgi:hypothetical protein